jgi:hypothetical protein
MNGVSGFWVRIGNSKKLVSENCLWAGPELDIVLLRIEKVEPLAGGANDGLIDQHFNAGFLEFISGFVEIPRTYFQS